MDDDESKSGPVGSKTRFNIHGQPRLLGRTAEGACKGFFKQVQWSPDGSSLLASTEDSKLDVYILPPDILDVPSGSVQSYRTLSPYTSIRECEPTKASLWYPGANLQAPETYCFVSSTTDQPIHLWDSLTGKLRASYPWIDHRERYLSPHSMTFSNDAENLICGTNSCISIFSLSNPGGPRTTINTSKLLIPSKGIISALSVSPDNILAAGALNNTVSLFSSEYEHISTFQSSNGSGITEIKWSPDGRYLYIIPRKSTTVEIWDIRSTGTTVASLTNRQALTNQRLWTDLSVDGLWFVSGGTDGKVRAWRTDRSGEILPSEELKVHDDCVSATVLHPSWSMMATASGSYHFDMQEEDLAVRDYSMKIWVFD